MGCVGTPWGVLSRQHHISKLLTFGVHSKSKAKYELPTEYARLVVMRTNMLIAAYDIYCITYYSNSNSNSNSNHYGTISKHILIVIQTNLVPHVRML